MSHPYIKFEHTELWGKVNQIIDDLIENQDIEVTTKKEYVVGYICENLIDMPEQNNNLQED
ncbi:hypothetical protein ACQKDB_12230 [Planococcus kocurii]|uniref:hypothetical protein n=1 Tax=Planococcus kocurii TaxID=1374 RepID=UPI003CFDC02B